MEVIVSASGEQGDPKTTQKGETAFLVGILSLVHVLLGINRKQAISGLILPDEMGRALLKYEGDIGRFLRLAECIDTGEFAELAEITEELSLTPSDVWTHQRDAYDWVMRRV